MGLTILCDSDNEFLARITSLLEPVEGLECVVVKNPAEAADRVINEDAWVVVFGPATDRESVLSAGARIASASRTVSLMMCASVESDLLRSAMRSGFRDVLESGSATYGDLGAAITDAYQVATAARAADEPAQRPAAKVISVFSTKGGVGKSVIASNLAAVLAEKMDKRVVLLDLDLEFGDGAVMLGLEPTLTIYDAVQAFDRLDAQMLDGFMREHSSGARVLLAPVEPEQAQSITAPRIARIISLAKDLADFVIIDTPGRLDESVLTAIDQSDSVLAIATMDLPSIKNTKVSLAKLRQLGYGNGLVSLVINRADSKVFLESADVERSVDTKVLARIPSDRLVPRSVNQGVPVALDQPRSAVAKSIVELAKLVSAK